MIDRIAPTRRPAGRVVGYQNWRTLLFAHWEVPRDALRAIVPESMELDLLDGRAYVGVVPFVMRDIRPSWWPRALAFNFLETNVRTYVTVNDRPGVYFLSLDANHRLAVWAARTGWGLPYHLARMTIHCDADEISYHTERSAGGGVLDVKYRLGDDLGPSAPDTIEHFFLERYLLFVEARGRVLEGQVHHVPYPAQQVELLSCRDGLVAVNGLPPVSGPPDFVHYAAGVDVDIFGLNPV